MDVILFLIFAAIAAACGFNVVGQSHPISSAISLIGVMGSLAALDLLRGARFLGAVAVVCGFNVVVQSHPISSAISLIGVMGSLAVLYLLLGAEFLAAAQVIVYAGAIMVLFVFVIMLLNAGAEIRHGRSLLAQVLGIPLLFTF